MSALEPEGGPKSRRGERPTGRLNTNPAERIGSRIKASKSNALFLATGTPVSVWQVTAWRHCLAMSQDGCESGETPERRTLDVATGCNKPGSYKVEQAVERLRKPADGT